MLVLLGKIARVCHAVHQEDYVVMQKHGAEKKDTASCRRRSHDKRKLLSSPMEMLVAEGCVQTSVIVVG